MKYLIAGAGAAGISAAETIRSLDPGGEITIYTSEAQGYYSRPALAYYLSREIKKSSLFPRRPVDLNKLRINLKIGRIRQIEPDRKIVLTSDNQAVPYEKLLLATGARATRPNLPGVELDGVVYLDSLSETEEMIRRARRRRTAVVVGGGITALEIVEGLLARKMKVHFLLRKEHYWGRVLDTVESAIILQRLEKEGVTIHRSTSLERISGQRGKVSGAVLSSGETLPADLVAFAIGVRPRPDLFETPGLKTQRGVRVNETMRTSLEDIYAAGDAAEVFDPQVESWVVDCLWPVARQQGITAGRNMAGSRTLYQRQTPLNVTRLAGLTTTIIGQVGSSGKNGETSIVRGESESWQMMPDAVICQNNFEVNRLRLMVGRELLLGAVLMGDQSLSPILERLVAKKIPITGIRDQLIQPGADLARILIDFDPGMRGT